MTVVQNYSSFENFPPSAKKVYEILLESSYMNIEEIANMTLYSDRTIRYAIHYLIRANLVIQLVDLNDARRHYYCAKETGFPNHKARLN
ncbi:MAG: MarR family transcriptional regulator [Candidatus Heimdallarchaeota archaeon]|nr:MarR family transcriptional regulator [Candidatus Heimdallarchaeota archaeon]